MYRNNNNCHQYNTVLLFFFLVVLSLHYRNIYIYVWSFTRLKRLDNTKSGKRAMRYSKVSNRAMSYSKSSKRER